MNGLLGARLIDENGQANGVIMVSDKINGEFTEEDEFFLRRLANMTSLALQHIKARQEVEQKAAELESRVQARTAELQQAYNVIRQNETLLQDLFENIGEGVVLFDIQGKVLKINKAAGEILRIDQSAVEGTYYDSPYWKGKITLPDETMLSRENLGAFLQMGLQQVQRNLEVQVQLADGSRRWLRGSVAPLAGSSSQVEGIIVTFADITTEKEFQREREQFSIRLLETQEQERKRIAYELHDDTAQYLSILKMQLGALIDSEEIQSPEIKEKLKYLERDADRAFNDVRRFSHELRPVALEHQGLAAALEQIVEDYNKLGGLCIKFQLEGVEPKLPEEIKLGFFRIAQEAVNNIRKHARASRAIIRLKVKKNLLEMSVSDNGTGFDVKSAEEEASNRGSLGMISMRERANLINADLKLESSPGKGTKVTLKAKINTP